MRSELRKAVWVGMLVLGVSAAAWMPVGAQELPAGRKVMKRVAPVYPPIALQARLTGTVKVMLTVAPGGTVKSVRTLGGNPVLVPAAEAAVKRWTFEVSTTESNETVSIIFGPAQ